MLNNILFYIMWGYARFLGFMPRFIQFFTADILYVVLYYIVGYRKKVARANLAESFPEKSKDELRRIERRFFRHLADVFVETLILTSASDKEMLKRATYTKEGITNFVDATNRSTAIAAMSHLGTWEYTIAFSAHTVAPLKAVYHKLANSAAERFYCKMRSRFGAKPVAMGDIAREVLKSNAAGEHAIIALIADQTPPKPHIKRWYWFLNRPTAFFTGMGRLATKYGMPTHYLDFTQERRGCYIGTFSEIYDGKEDISEYELTRRYAKKLEESVRRDPHLWVWTHKRWKHFPPDNSENYVFDIDNPIKK